MYDPFALTEDQQLYYKSELRYSGPSFAKVIVRKIPYDFFAGVDKEPLVRDICKTYEDIISSPNFKHHESFYPILDQNYADAYECNQILIVYT